MDGQAMGVCANLTISYSYDADNRETTKTWANPSGGSPLDVVTYTYNSDGEVTKISDDYSSYEYNYNADGEETSFSDTGTSGLAQETLTYSYDGDRNRTSMSDSLGGVVSYTYDAREELINETFSGSGPGISAEAVKYAYDPAGNRGSQTPRLR
jgi:YD repeat-containing protein